MKKIFVILMTVCLMATALCITAAAGEASHEHPAGTVMCVSASKGNATELIGDYTSFRDGWNAAMDLAGDKAKMKAAGYDRVIVDLCADWVADSKGEFGSGDGFDNDTIYIPEDARVTLNMNDHIINRGLTTDQNDGEVIFINDDADVIINSGTIKGGYSNSEGGGLYIEGGAYVTLNNVNIIGNAVRADDGAGIYMYGGSTLIMNGGSVSNNFVDSKYVFPVGDIDPFGVVYVENSTAVFSEVTFDGNYTYSYSARGLVIYADNSTVKMDKCTVSGNATKESVADDIIYAEDSSLSITDTNFVNNNTLELTGNVSGVNPALFYVYDSNLSLNGGNITQNGGDALFFFYDSNADMKGVTITDNAAVVLYVDNGNEVVNMTQCILGNNQHKSSTLDIQTINDGTVAMVDCELGDTTFSHPHYVQITTSEVSREEGIIGISLLDKDGAIISASYYKEFASGWRYAMQRAKANDYSRIVVDLYGNWSTGADEHGALQIPENARVTLNMNGYKIDREKFDPGLNGEVLCIGVGADVIINNGTITGGYSTNGAGGIHIKDNAKVVLNNVNVVGNVSDGSNGAAIAVCDGAVLVMEGGSISNNVLVSSDFLFTLITVYPYGTLYVEDATATLNNVTINGNRSTDAEIEGVAIYADSSTVTLKDCVVSNNDGDPNDADHRYAVSIIGGKNSEFIINNTSFTENGSISDTDDIDYSHLFYLEGGNLTMTGGKITGNKADKLFYIYGTAANIHGVTMTDNESVSLHVINPLQKATLTECILDNNSPIKYEDDVIVEVKDSVIFEKCELGDTTYANKSMVVFSNKAVGSMLGGGSLTMIVAFIALTASVASIVVNVSMNKKKAAPAVANDAEETEEEE